MRTESDAGAGKSRLRLGPQWIEWLKKFATDLQQICNSKSRKQAKIPQITGDLRGENFRQKERKNPSKPCGSKGFSWWRLLDSNQWPHACGYSIEKATVAFPFHPGLSCPDFVISAARSLRHLRLAFPIVGQKAKKGRTLHWGNPSLDVLSRAYVLPCGRKTF